MREGEREREGETHTDRVLKETLPEVLSPLARPNKPHSLPFVERPLQEKM